MADHEADMLKIKRRHDSGDKRAVLDAYLVCTVSVPQKPLPQWAIRGFALAYGAVMRAESRSWNDVFGARWPKGTRLADARTRIQYRYKVWHYCRSLHANGMAIGPALYERAAKKLGFGKRQVKEMFEDYERSLGHRSNLWGTPRKTRFKR